MFPLKKCKWGRAKCRILNSKPFYEFMRHKFFCAIPPKERPSMKELSTIIRVLSLTMREVLADESDEIKMPARLGKLVIRKFRLSQSHPYIGPKGTWFYRLR
jgi:hypothetical protein